MLLPQPRLPLPHGCLGMPAAGSVAPRTATRIPHGVVSPAASSQHPPHPARPRTNGKYTPRCAPQRKRHTPHPSPHPTPITREWNHMQNESHSTHNTARHTAAAHGSTHDTRETAHQAVSDPQKHMRKGEMHKKGSGRAAASRAARTRAWWLLLHMREPRMHNPRVRVGRPRPVLLLLPFHPTSPRWRDAGTPSGVALFTRRAPSRGRWRASRSGWKRRPRRRGRASARRRRRPRRRCARRSPSR